MFGLEGEQRRFISIIEYSDVQRSLGDKQGGIDDVTKALEINGDGVFNYVLFITQF